MKIFGSMPIVLDMKVHGYSTKKEFEDKNSRKYDRENGDGQLSVSIFFVTRSYLVSVFSNVVSICPIEDTNISYKKFRF